ncbi:MAG: HAMP domain-containing histidine kinase [Candidatus Promineofilum sp.]|nr:HAMP domain-containing histidine kinase [Promineifilum sp.]
MNDSNAMPRRAVAGWFGRAPWRILLIGVALALVVATALFYGLMAPGPGDLALLAATLGVASVLAVGLGYLLYRRGWVRSSSLMVTLMATYLWAGLVTLLPVWLLQRQMFFNAHDLALSGVLLLFAAIVATAYGLFVAAGLTEGLHQTTAAADRLAAGDVAARVPVAGRDEVARLGQSFNAMADQLQAAADRRREAESLRRNLVAWTSHDLRTPLTAIRVRVEALHDGLVSDPAEARRYVAAMRTDVMALDSLLDDLFELAQLDAGGPAAARQPHAPADLVADCLERFAPLAEQRGVTLAGEVAAGLPAVAAQPGKIERVLGNLVGNALRHTPPGGRVTVGADVAPEGVVFVVADTGPGFSPADLAHGFEQFYRGEAARSRATGGAGLGLAIARGIVEAHGGRIWAENRAEGGAQVSFLLPRILQGRV